jgi:hypothetical protein
LGSIFDTFPRDSPTFNEIALLLKNEANNNNNIKIKNELFLKTFLTKIGPTVPLMSDPQSYFWELDKVEDP